MLFDRQHIAYTGDVGAGGFPALNQLGGNRVGYGREDDRNIPGGCGNGLRRRCCNSNDNVWAFTHKLTGDLGRNSGIALGTFMHDTQVFTDAVTTLGQFVDNTLMGSIQCRVLNNLGDGNYTSVFCLNQACGGEQRRADQGTQSFLGHMPISGSVAGFPLERGGKRSKFGSLPQGYGVRDRVCSELCWLSLLNILNCR